MATIYNSDLSKELTDGAKIQVSRDSVPNQLAEKVVPVMEVNPKMFRRINFIKNATSGGTVYTTPTDKDFYYVGSNISGANSTASQNSTLNLTVVPEGQAAVSVNALYGRTTVILDVVSVVSNVILPFPIKLAKGSAITANASNWNGLNLSIFGYFVDNPNA